MKPIHFRPNQDASARNEAALRAYEASQGSGVAAVVRSATANDRAAAIQHQRRVQLDDYVTKIRQTARDAYPADSHDAGQTERPEVIFKTRIQDSNETLNRDAAFEVVHTAADDHSSFSIGIHSQ